MAGSETFIRNQTSAISRWRPVTVGIKRVESVLSLPSDHVLFDNTFAGRLQRKIFRFTKRSQRLNSTVTRLNPQIIHAHFGRDALLILPVAIRAKIPIVVTFHGFDVTSLATGNSRSARKYRRELKVLFRQATLLIAVSEFIRNRLIDLGAPSSKIRVHYIGIPLDEISTATDVQREGILFVGRLTEKKGVEDLLHAVAMLPTEDLRGTAITIVGEGHLRSHLLSLAANLGVDARFTGSLPPTAVHELMSHSQIFCAPSKTAPNGDAEGLGMVFLEAQLYGLPVVSYHHGGVPEAVTEGQAGMLAPEGDVETLAQQIGYLLLNPGVRAQMSASGQMRVMSRFDVDKQTAELELLYDLVVENSSVS